jgi:DNA-binding NtrC family response regulator
MFLKQLEAEQQLRADLTADAIEYLSRASWPGQVRELQTTIKVVVSQLHAERAVDGMSHGNVVIGVKPVREYLQRRARGYGAAPRTEAAARKRPADLSASEVQVALQAHRGNKTRAAKALGIAVNTLKKKLLG